MSIIIVKKALILDAFMLSFWMDKYITNEIGIFSSLHI